jgi:hypothetical protein
MRFGQLIVSVCTGAGSHSIGDVEATPDDRLLESVSARLRDLAGPQPSCDDATCQGRTELVGALNELSRDYPDFALAQLMSRVAEEAYKNVYDISDHELLTCARRLLRELPSLPRVTYRFSFPEVIATHLKYFDRLAPTDYTSADIPDGRRMLEWYFRWATSGRKYEQEIHEKWNADVPNALTRKNFANARRVSSIGWSYEGVADLIDQPLPELALVPAAADLFQSNRFDEHVIKLGERLMSIRGLQVANVTKLLYQKRPYLVPILDSWVRQATNVPYCWDGPSRRQAGLSRTSNRKLQHGDGFTSLDNVCFWLDLDSNLGAFGIAFRQFRHLMGYSNNRRALFNLESWIAEGGLAEEAIPSLSTVRILDVLAWSLIWHMKHKADGSEYYRVIGSASLTQKAAGA